MAINPSSMKVALISGGTSGERPISLASGEGAAAALAEAGFNVTKLDPAAPQDLERLMGDDFDIAFLCLHGRGGEDGSFQGFCELIGLPYTCSGIQASAIAIDKKKSKFMYNIAGVPTAPAVYVTESEGFDAAAIVAQLGNRVVVKPACEGSSLGVEIVEGADALAEALGRAFTFDKSVVVEKFIQGTEVTAPVLGNDDVQALPIIQMTPTGEFYDFDSKYAPGGSVHTCPAPIGPELTEKIQRYSCMAHKAIGCAGCTRTDFIIEENGDVWALETNTIPGMTATSLMPESAAAAGISFPELTVRLVELGLQRAGRL